MNYFEERDHIKNLLILGGGYTGSHLKNFLVRQTPNTNVLSTRRKMSQSDVLFDLDDRATWSNIPKVDGTFWTFPAKPLPLVKDFLKLHKEKLGKIIVIGSTGSFSVQIEGQEVDEFSSTDDSLERTLGEKFICNQEGTVVYAAGIYGPGRNPIEWVTQGRIRSSKKLLNLIHVDDLTQILFKAMVSQIQEKVFIAADNSPFTWEHLIETYNLKPSNEAPQSRRTSKRINSSWSLKTLDVQLNYPSVKVFLNQIEK